MEIEHIPVQGFSDQKPGTSGLRRKTNVFKQKHYIECFIQSLFDALPAHELDGCTLLVSGDGRYYTKEAIQSIVEVAAGNRVGKVWIGLKGLVSTPAASAIIRNRQGGQCYGGIILTASHNPGGPDNDFGIKYNTSDGGPASEQLTDCIYEKTQCIKEYHRRPLEPLDLSTLGTTSYFNGQLIVEIIDPIIDWMKLMKEVFDFGMLREFFRTHPDFHIAYDGLHGVAGIYAKALVEEINIAHCTLLHCDSKEDFGGLHPDPNLTYATSLVDLMKISAPHLIDSTTPNFAAAGDGDNDRNMILGPGFFVNPSDSVAIIAAYAESCIPYFKKNKISGVARSMPTSSALDSVAKMLDIPCYETPTGWKYFVNLMNAGLVSICGEESFGTGSNHIREKDGLWAVLCWLSIIAYRSTQTSQIKVQDIVEEFWFKFGRCYYTRHDYENIECTIANQILSHFDCFMQSKNLGYLHEMNVSNLPDTNQCKHWKLLCADDYSYHDVVDKSISKHQGYRFIYDQHARIIFRQSGTGSDGVTIRIYIEQHNPAVPINSDTQIVLKDLIQLATSMSQIQTLSKRNAPSVIT